MPPTAVTAGVANVADLLRRAAAQHGGRTALVVAGQRPTWAELDARVDAVAGGLGRLGLVVGDRVAIALGTGVPFVVAWFAALRAGLAAVPINPNAAGPELAHQVVDSGARVIVTERPLGRAADLEQVEQVVVGTPPWSALLAGSGPVGTTAGGEDLAALVYTSGTSGRPRGAMLSHRALLANLAQVGALEPALARADDVVFLPLPLFHIYGLNTGLCLATAVGATSVLMPRFDPVEALALMAAEHVTTIVGVPAMYVAWSLLPDTAGAFDHVRLATSGSAPLPPEVLDRLGRTSGLAVHEGYGMTETAPVLTLTPPASPPKPGSVGRPVPGVELRLVDENGADADGEDQGVVVVRGANLFSGYWPDGRDGPDAQGWFSTGDIGVLDDDGDLHLVDRASDLILVSGFNVYPREVEDVLRTHPGVADVAVVGVPHPYTGEAVKALVVAAPGAAPTPEALGEHAAASLARFKCPTSYELVPSLPHTVIGKVSRTRLRDER